MKLQTQTIFCVSESAILSEQRAVDNAKEYQWQFKSKERFYFKVFATEDEYMTEEDLKHSFKSSMKINYSIIVQYSNISSSLFRIRQNYLWNQTKQNSLFLWTASSLICIGKDTDKNLAEWLLFCGMKSCFSTTKRLPPVFVLMETVAKWE